MRTQDIQFFNEVIKPRLVQMAIDGTLPSDMTELTHHHFDNDAKAFYNTNIYRQANAIDRLENYVSEDSTEAYHKLINAEAIDPQAPADCVVSMWQPLQGRYTVQQLLNEIVP